METTNELVQMRVRTIDEAINTWKLLDNLTFDQVLADDEKMDILMGDSQDFKLILEEINEPHRLMLGIINPDQADLLDRAIEDPEEIDATLPYQTVKFMKNLGFTVEKAVVTDRVEMTHRTILTLRKEDGTVMEMPLTLFDALVVAMVAKAPFYVREELLKVERPDFAQSVPNAKIVLLRMMPLRALKREMDMAVRQEDYEYAEMIKREIATRKVDEEEEEEDNEEID
ncbi:DUF151 domain-containing protein [Phocaeicola plebeius]|uniref:DUF151 domain-containing protein n=1 Tax=Phocaeicola plebeius TaxID=310297 RepID=UPI0026EA8EE3|nr:DUF151 domain-containing protein [Phocaeicola plebeius]